MEFAALHIRTGYSCLESGITLKNAFLAANKQNYVGFGLTDVNSVIGYPELNSLVKKSKLKPIYGIDVKFNEDTLSLYCLNEAGYKNLIAIIYEQSINQISLEFLRAHSKGIGLILDVSLTKIKDCKTINEVRDYLLPYQTTFDIFELGLPYGPNNEEIVNKIRNFVQKYPYTLIAFPHILYEKAENAIVLDIVHAIKNGTNLTEKKASGYNYFLSLEEIKNFYTEEEIAETVKFLNKSEFVFQQKRGTLTKFATPNGESADEYLRKISFEGLESKIPSYSKEYEDRLNYELKVISDMGYSDYFLIVMDYVNFAKKNGILVGPGRGSGAGSLVAFSLGISKGDPIKYGLLFERFLNPQRQSMPDLDVDFADYRRDEVAQYVTEKYGTDKVAKIITMQTLGAKSSLRDIGRVFRVEDRDITMLCNAVLDPDKNLRENYKISKNLKELVDSEPQFLEIVALASKLEDLPRQTSFHAPGLILNNEPLKDSIPVIYDPVLGMIAQYEHDYLEDQGFLKMDILSLRNLSIVETCLDRIKHNKHIDLKYEDIPFDDPKAIETIKNLNVMGLFQLESTGMKNAAKKLCPTEFKDIVALISLFRPGPMNEIETYAARKQGRASISYLSPEFESILKPTYGVMIYQEQIMMVVQKFAGFSYGEADLFRRAIAKKDLSKLTALKDKFIKGCLAKGHSQDSAIKTYNLIEKFADYGFNKSHALSYAILACQMAYLKAYYPEEFYTTILDYSSSVGDTSFVKTIAEIKKLGIKLCPPSINESGINFVIKNNCLLIPLIAIKKVSYDLAKDIVLDRNSGGIYTDIFDFVLRAKQHGLTQPDLVRIIDSGALDCLNPNRTSLRESSFDLVNYAEMFYGENGQRILLDFNMPKPVLKNVENNVEINLVAEKEAVGMMLSSSPLATYRKMPKYSNLETLSDLENSNGFTKVLCIVEGTKAITTKKGSSMAFVTIYDEDTTKEVIAFDRTFTKYFTLLKKDKILLAEIKRDTMKENSFILETLVDVSKE